LPGTARARAVPVSRRRHRAPHRLGGRQRLPAGDARRSVHRKGFRTWGATLFAFRTLATTPLPDEGNDARQHIRQATLRQAAAILGNTPRICEKCYVDPRVFAGWEDGRTQQAATRARGLRQWEQAAIRFLARARHG